MLTKAQVAWASLHDWFAWDNQDGTITVRDFDERFEEVYIRWTLSFRELRNWAGY